MVLFSLCLRFYGFIEDQLMLGLFLWIWCRWSSGEWCFFSVDVKAWNLGEGRSSRIKFGKGGWIS